MKNQFAPRHFPAQQAGLSLIELMVSITIGLVILLAIGTVFMTGSNTQRIREDLSEVHEPARILHFMLQTNANQAGYVDYFDAPGDVPRASEVFAPQIDAQNSFVRNPATGTVTAPIETAIAGLQPVFGCDGAMNGAPLDMAAASAVALSCGTASTKQHSLQFAFQSAQSDGQTGAVAALGAASSTTGVGQDCLQQKPEKDKNLQGIVINRFFVKTSPADGVNDLYCEGSGNKTAQPIARGVEELVVRYQVSSAGVTGTAAGASKSQWMTAAEVAADAVGWPGVTAIEVCVAIATPSTRAAAQGTSDLQVTRPTCVRNDKGELVYKERDTGDKRLWKRFISNYVIRNSVISSPAG